MIEAMKPACFWLHTVHIKKQAPFGAISKCRAGKLHHDLASTITHRTNSRQRRNMNITSNSSKAPGLVPR